MKDDELEEGISFPEYGFYSVQDESKRRYSRTGKHRISAQKYDTIRMKYRYSDETEKSSPYSRTLSESESLDPTDSSGEYQGVYSPQLEQQNAGSAFEDTLWESSREPRRSWLHEDEPAGKWISPGVGPVITDPLEKRRFRYSSSDRWKNLDQHQQDEAKVVAVDFRDDEETFDETNSKSYLECRRSWIEEEPLRDWISPDVHQVNNADFENKQQFRYNSDDPGINWALDDDPYLESHEEISRNVPKEFERKGSEINNQFTQDAEKDQPLPHYDHVLTAHLREWEERALEDTAKIPTSKANVETRAIGDRSDNHHQNHFRSVASSQHNGNEQIMGTQKNGSRQWGNPGARTVSANTLVEETSSGYRTRREPPPPYSVAVRSSKGHASKAYRDAVPCLTKDLQDDHGINRLLDDLEGSNTQTTTSYDKRCSDKVGPEPRVDASNKSPSSAWAELVHIEDSEDEPPTRPNSGIIVNGQRERRTSSPDRHIRFELERTEAANVLDDGSRIAKGGDNVGLESQRTQEQGAEFPGERGQTTNENTVGLTPLMDEVFKLSRSSDQFTSTSQKHEKSAHGVDNLGYSYDVEGHDHTSLDHNRPHQRQHIDWYGRGHVYDSSQSSTLDSVFTERSWSSEIGRPRTFREKRRVFPKPKDPVGDLGDGLKTKSKMGNIPRGPDDHQRMTTASRGHNKVMKGHHQGAPPRGENVDHRMKEQDLRRSIIKRELELFMHRNSRNRNNTSRRPSVPYYSNGISVTGSRSSSNESTRPYKIRHEIDNNIRHNNTYRHGQGGTKSSNLPHRPRTFSDESLQKDVHLRNPNPGRKKERPLTYPNDINRPYTNDINRPFSTLFSQGDNNNNSLPKSVVSSLETKGFHTSRNREMDRHPVSLQIQHGPKTGTGRHGQKNNPPETNRGLLDSSMARSDSIPRDVQLLQRSTDSQNTDHQLFSAGRPIGLPQQDKSPQKMSDERRNRDDGEWASPTVTAVSEELQRQHDQGTNSNHVDPGRIGQGTPTNAKNTDTGSFSNWRFFSVMATIWFFPIGIWALRKSYQVDSRVKAKDLPAARRASKSARNHAIAAFVVLGFIVIILLGRVIEITIDPRKTFIQNYEIVPQEDAV